MTTLCFQSIGQNNFCHPWLVSLTVYILSYGKHCCLCTLRTHPELGHLWSPLLLLTDWHQHLCPVNSARRPLDWGGSNAMAVSARKPGKASSLWHQNAKDSQSQATNQSSHFPPLPAHILWVSHSSGACPWSTPNHFWLGTTQFKLILALIKSERF